MIDTIIAATPENMEAAQILARDIGVELAPIETSTFPDGETKVRATKAGLRTILFHRLDHPNDKLITLILAVSALRELGATEIVLVAPYLCYMRQDQAFQTGEAVSQRVIARLLSQWVDHIVTVEPHLHRTKNLSAIFPHTKTTAISAAPLLAALIDNETPPSEILLIGPDAEAHAWTKAVSERAGVPFIVLRKTQHGDRDVTITIDERAPIAGKHVYLVDDIVSSGATLCAAAQVLKKRGAARIVALAVHALCGEKELKEIKNAGIVQLLSTDTIPHKTSAISAISLIARAVM